MPDDHPPHVQEITQYRRGALLLRDVQHAEDRRDEGDGERERTATLEVKEAPMDREDRVKLCSRQVAKGV